MIYEYPDQNAPLRQGDIFVGLPRIDISLEKVLLIKEDGQQLVKWDDIATEGQVHTVIVPVRSVWAMVATQDCDTVYSRDITLCEIRNFRDVERKGKDAVAANSWRKLITQQARFNQKWFYLPLDSRIGLNEKKAVDFLVTLRLPRADLESLRTLRKGRLNKVADEHFRERISEFFRRYPYDEWYPLDKEELKAYVDEYPNTKPYPWQDFTPSSEKNSS